MENGSNQSGVDFSGDTLAPSAERPTKIRWLIFALTCSISFVLYLHRYTWAMVKKDISEEFEWNATQLGYLDGIFSATYALGQIPSGILCDWFGLALCGWSVGRVSCSHTHTRPCCPSGTRL